LGYAIVVFAIMAIMSFTFGVWLVSGGGGIGKAVKEPLVPATLLGGGVYDYGLANPNISNQ
jgi:hypothetical protein